MHGFKFSHIKSKGLRSRRSWTVPRLPRTETDTNFFFSGVGNSLLKFVQALQIRPV
jgi:hypothetical protein